MVRMPDAPYRSDPDGWLRALVGTFEAIADSDTGTGPCRMELSERSYHAVLRHLDRSVQPTRRSSAETADHSPAICSRGREPRSMPRSLVSSCMM